MFNPLLSLELHTLGKKFRKEWIFRKLNFQLAAGEKAVILGGNGSGKSTLLQIISGFMAPSEGDMQYRIGQETVAPEQLYKHLSYASPYLHLIEEYSLQELLEHSTGFKPLLKGINTTLFCELVQLPQARHKAIREFSSGMKQRLKLGLAILSDSQLLLLDEPLSNLDKNGVLWYKEMVTTYCSTRSVLVCSNAIEAEYSFCTKELQVTDFKS